MHRLDIAIGVRDRDVRKLTAKNTSPLFIAYLLNQSHLRDCVEADLCSAGIGVQYHHPEDHHRHPRSEDQSDHTGRYKGIIRTICRSAHLRSTRSAAI
jgi:hypothetical protein